MHMHNTFIHGFPYFSTYTRSCVCFSHYKSSNFISYLQLPCADLFECVHSFSFAAPYKVTHDDA